MFQVGSPLGVLLLLVVFELEVVDEVVDDVVVLLLVSTDEAVESEETTLLVLSSMDELVTVLEVRGLLQPLKIKATAVRIMDIFFVFIARTLYTNI